MIKRVFRKIIGFIKYSSLLLTLLFKKLFIKKNIWFITTPIYANIGDYAIVYAQYEFFKDIGLDKYIIDLNRKQFETLKKFIPFFVKKNDLVIIDGGGNIGTIWMEEEKRIRTIIKMFPNNPIYIFPQTAFFDDNENGKIELENSIKIYNSHSDLTIFCRDINTYNLFNNYFSKVKVFLVPDMVMYLNNLQYEGANDNIIYNIREDKESIYNIEIIKSTKEELLSKGYTVKDSSTIVHGINKKNRFDKVKSKLLDYASSKLVITDRLHGMIFSAIVGTPCIAVDNISHKVKNCYKWLDHLDYIYYCDNMDLFKDCIGKVDTIISKRGKYTRHCNDKYFDVMKNEVLNKFNS